MMQSKANAHNHQFLRYKQFSVWWLLIGWSLGVFLRCQGVPSIIGKVFVRAFQCNLDHWKRPSICGDRSEWSLWQSTSSIITSPICIALTSIHSFFTNTLSLLSLSVPTCQSGLWLKPCAFPMLLPGTCFRVKLNLDRYNAHLACRQFNFWLLMKYSRFLWLLHISKLFCAPSNKCLYSSKHLMIASISWSWIL